MLEDDKTYRLLAEGNTQNVFQFSSPGITRFIQDVRPKCIEDLIAINALYRPATLDIGATEDYIRFRRGKWRRSMTTAVTKRRRTRSE